MVGGHHRYLADPLGEVFVGTHGIHDGEAGKQVLDHRPAGLILRQILRGRFVGNVEIRAVRDIQGYELCAQGGQESGKECLVFFGESLLLPAEDLFIFAVDIGHDLRAALAAPLSEQMGNLEVLDAAVLGHFDEPGQFIKVKRVAAVFQGDIHQLNGGALAADLGIQRRGENGG